MGMYDHVDFEVSCPNCKHLVTGFQTKDRDNALEIVSPVGLDKFYSECDHCKAWLVYRCDSAREGPVLDFKEMFFEMAFSQRLLRDKVFGLCDKLDVKPAELFKLVEAARKKRGM